MLCVVWTGRRAACALHACFRLFQFPADGPRHHDSYKEAEHSDNVTEVTHVKRFLFGALIAGESERGSLEGLCSANASPLTWWRSGASPRHYSVPTTPAHFVPLLHAGSDLTPALPHYLAA
ncbi:hypothetical protein E2C01_028780 [Portunus trituberculatus]|uniref:Uncharacterized protein n=1 Tax=Portunus trituberculatus TaxID=210409 RepID=A0A5B7EQE2_PORTR|nr:hypothetical protein [Portunus trituberculatus]